MADKTIILSKDPSQLCQEIPLIEGDNNTYVIRFVAPRYSGGVDLASLTWGVNIKNATLEQGFVNLSSATSDDSAVYIDWNVGSFATVLHGLSFCTIEGRNNSSSAHPVWKSSVVVLRVGRAISADDIIDGSDINSITEIAENVAESIVANSVRYDTSQSLNSTQKTTARTNIGAVSQAEVQQAVATETSAREAAVAAEATARETADNELKSAFSVESNNANGQVADVIALNGLHRNETNNGVTFAWSQDGKICHASGTSFANSNGLNNIWVQSTIFPPALLNRKPLFYVESTNPDHLYGQAYWYIGGSIQPERIDLKNGFTEVEIPSTANGFALRIIADKGQIEYDDDISIKLVLGDQCYIPSFGISTIDTKAAIESVLAAFGECRLGPGVFGVSGIDMPEGSMLSGCGDKTIIRLTGSSAGYAVKMTNNCTIKDLLVEGSNTDITLSETVGNRHGILWQGDYSSSSDKENQPSYGTISNVFVRRFTGGAITCDNTGSQVNHGLNVCDVSIVNCNAGINIAYYSEFHRFTNVNAYLCQYGCVNNGGNNVFVNCGFSNCKTGMICKMVDDSGRSKTNNTHGSAIGCVFNHIDRDETTLGKGYAVYFDGTDNGFVFEGCQLFYSKIHLADSKAVSFNACRFGPNRNSDGTTVGYDITLVNTDATNRKAFFNGCTFSRQPVFSISNNGTGTVAPIITACYTDGGSVVTE